jgi:hypothetical protein
VSIVSINYHVAVTHDDDGDDNDDVMVIFSVRASGYRTSLIFRDI